MTTCILHFGKGTIGTRDTWKQTHDIAEKRKKRSSKSKYNHFKVPETFKEVDANMGYHVDCYRKFTALTDSIRSQEEEEQEEATSSKTSELQL